MIKGLRCESALAEQRTDQNPTPTERQTDRTDGRFKEDALKSISYLMPAKESSRAGAGNGMKDATFAYRGIPKSHEKLNQKID